MRAFIEFSDPFSRPLHFLMLELVVLACTILVFSHALAEFRRGDRRHLFQWLVISSYGVAMEIIAFNFIDNYEHAQFTVQLYDGKLPLYVVGLYGSFMYTGIKIVERLGLHPVAEAALAGLAICLIDVPFDIAGIALGWWVWFDTDPTIAYRWLDVPVTSYYWYLTFGAMAALECRLLWRWLESRSFAVAALVAPFAGVGVIVLGVLAFLPFHGLVALGLSEGSVVALHMLACVGLALWARGARQWLSPKLAAVVLLLPGWHVVLLVWAALAGKLKWPGEQAGWAIAAYAGLIFLISVLPLRHFSQQPVSPPAGG